MPKKDQVGLAVVTSPPLPKKRQDSSKTIRFGNVWIVLEFWNVWNVWNFLMFLIFWICLDFLEILELFGIFGICLVFSSNELFLKRIVFELSVEKPLSDRLCAYHI